MTYYNHEHYRDPTAGTAEGNIARQTRREQSRREHPAGKDKKWNKQYSKYRANRKAKGAQKRPTSQDTSKCGRPRTPSATKTG